MQTLEEKITFLYPAQAEETLTKLNATIDEYRKKLSSRQNASSSPFFSEKDAVLITYADHVEEEGIKTLKTMHKFLNEFSKGLLNKVHFLPFYPYTSDDGFSVIDYYKIKEEFGDWTDLADIHKDFLLMYDFVANHISQKSEWFQKFLQGDEDFEKYFVVFDKEVDTSSVFRARTHPLLTKFETAKGPKYVWTTFSADQIDLNPENPELLLELVKVLLFYIEQGADTIRLDAIAYLWKKLGTSSIHLEQTHVIVKLFRQIIDMLASDVWIITETNVAHKLNIAYFGTGNDEAHLVYNFSLPPLLLYSLISGNAEVLSQWAKNLEYPSDKATFFNFTASHDGIGVTALFDFISEDEVNRVIEHVKQNGGKVNYRTVPGGQRPYELNIVYLNAVGGKEQFIASQAIELSLRGVPAVYFNSLIGETNWTEGVDTLGYNRAINRRKFHFDELVKELRDKNSQKNYIYERYKQLLQVRTTEPLFSPSVPQEVLSLDPRLFVLKRSKENNNLLAITNVSGEKVIVTNLESFLQKNTAINLLTKQEVDLTQQYEFGPYEILWIK